MKPEEIIRKKSCEIIEELGISDVLDSSVEYTQNTDFGDLSSNIALINYSKIKEKYVSSKEFAQNILDKLTQDPEINNLFSQVSVAGPGFINFQLKPEIFEDFLKLINTDLDRILKTDINIQKIMVEFAHPNTHKQMHIGHLRTLLIGESLSRIFKTLGHDIFKANYQGDIGPHVAKAVYGVQNLLKEKELELDYIEEKTPFEKAKFLQEAYVAGNQDYEEHKEEIDGINMKLYSQDPDIQKVYKTTRGWSLEYFDAIYKYFCVSFDRLFFETETADCGKKIVEENIGKVFKVDNGAVIFEGEKYGLHSRVFITSQGYPTYEAKDMCLANIQYEMFPFDLNIHVVASEQTGYFKVIIKTLELIDPKFKGKQYHLSMGLVKLTGGKVSSRTGEIIAIEDLIAMIKQEVEKLVGEGRIEKVEKEDSIDKIAKAAIVYSYLKVNPTMNLVFDISKSISLDGDSGPYLLYTYARIKSVIKKAGIPNANLQFPNFKLNGDDLILARRLYRFPEIVYKAGREYAPNIVAEYLYDLAKEFNAYYQKVPILKAQTEDLVNIRLMIIGVTAKVLKEGLMLLNIETVERM